MRHIWLSLLLLCAAARAHAYPWTTSGPIVAEVRTVVSAPSRAQTLYAVTAGAVFRSTDGGMTWIARDGLENISLLAVDPSDDHVVYAASRGGIFKSGDGAATFQPLTLSKIRPTAIVIDPRNPQTIYVGSECETIFARTAPSAVIEQGLYESAGVFKSTDAGATWNLAVNGMTAFQVCVEQLALDPATPDTLYARSVFNDNPSSDDGARNWTRAPGLIPTGGVVADPRQPAKRYGIHLDTFLVSEDAGATWSRTMPQGIRLGSVYLDLTIDPEAGRLFLATTTGVYRSGDGGHSWLPLPGPASEKTNEVIFDTAGSVLTIATETGLYQSEGFPWDVWSQRPFGEIATTIRNVAAHPSDPGTIYATSSSRIFRTRDGGRLWDLAAVSMQRDERDIGAFPGRGAGGGLTVDRGGTAYVIADNNGNTQLYKLPPGASELVGVSVPPPTSDPLRRDVLFVVADPNNREEVYVGRHLEIAHTRDGGATWEQSPLPPDFHPRSLVIDPRDSNILYLATLSGILKSTDRGRTWTIKTREFVPARNVDIAISPADSSVLYMLSRDENFRESFVRSTDGGDTWMVFDAPPGGVSALAPDSRRAFTLYAGTLTSGVLRSTDGGMTWESIAEGLPPERISALVVDAAGMILHAATQGRGVWELPIGSRRRAVRRD